MLTLFQLSDIHFIDDATLDIDVELRDAVLRFAPTVISEVGPADAVVVCGDVAFSGRSVEYARASSFLRDLEAALGARRTLVIPGNHDIHLPATDNADQRHWRSKPRQAEASTPDRDRALAELIKDERAGPGLLAALENYIEFANQFDCEIRVEQPYWEIELPIDSGVVGRVRGLTSVLVSDAHDKTDRLVLGSIQVANIRVETGFVNLTLCHHPYESLLDGEDQRTRLDNRSAVHVTGHTHVHSLRETPLGIHLSAGALQPSRRVDDWDPRVNVIRLESVRPASGDPLLRISIWAAHWDPAADRFKFEAGQPTVRECPLQVDDALPNTTAIRRQGDLARLRRRLTQLPRGDQFEAARVAGLDLESIASSKANEIPGVIIEEAERVGLLPEVWKAVESLHGHQSDEPSPFDKST